MRRLFRWFKNGFPVRGFKWRAGVTLLAAGDYGIVDASDGDPVNIDGAWVLSDPSVLQDVGANDQTTYLESTAGVTRYVKALRVFGSLTEINTWTAAVYGNNVTDTVYYSNDGSTWTQWDTMDTAGTGMATWKNVAANPGLDVVQVLYVQLVHIATAAVGRIGDWRLS
jgi:hypothetical protein